MTVFIGLLRGVNVGGHQMLSNAALKEACERAGSTDVRPYLQSGNVVFRSAEKSASRVAAAIRAELDTPVAVILRTAAALRKVIADNPFREAARREPSRLLVLFADGAIDAAAKALLESQRAPSESIAFAKTEVYAWMREGAGRSKLFASFTPKKLGFECTSRNWNTVTALLEIAEEL